MKTYTLTRRSDGGFNAHCNQCNTGQIEIFRHPKNPLGTSITKKSALEMLEKFHHHATTGDAHAHN